MHTCSHECCDEGRAYDLLREEEEGRRRDVKVLAYFFGTDSNWLHHVLEQSSAPAGTACDCNYQAHCCDGSGEYYCQEWQAHLVAEFRRQHSGLTPEEWEAEQEQKRFEEALVANAQ